MRVLWISDSPDTPSGFGNVTRFVCGGLARRGHRVGILGWQTHEHHNWEACEVYPARGSLGSEALFPLLTRYRPEVVIALADVWWLPYFSLPHVRRQMDLTNTPWALYFPIDGNMEGGKLPGSWLDLLHEVDVPIAMSRYGQGIAKNCGIPCEYIPHGVDLNIFSPPPDRQEAKRKVGAFGKFLVLSDSRNQARKMLPRLLDIFARFAQDCPNALLHLHTDPDDDFTKSIVYSYDVRADSRELEIESKVLFTPGMAMKRGGGIALTDLAAYYQAADVHLLASSGEGFGLPTLQAAAAGAIPMAGAYSASQELVEGHGEAIEIAGWAENEFGVRRAFLDVRDAAQKLARYYHDPTLLAERSQRCRVFAESYGWESVIDQWDALLRSIRRRRRMSQPVRATTETRMASLIPGLTGTLPEGVSVRVKVAEQEYGRLEASILADTRGRASDVKIPTVPKPSVTGGVKVVRCSGYVGIGLGDTGIFKRLRRIFPILTGWLADGQRLGYRAVEDCERAGVSCPEWEVVEEARLKLAQSVLVLNVSGSLPRQVLLEAALFGVPCIGANSMATQEVLWPLLLADNEEQAVQLGRRVLTDATFAQEVAAAARKRCDELYAPDEQEIAVWLRRLSDAEQVPAESGAPR